MNTDHDEFRGWPLRRKTSARFALEGAVLCGRSVAAWRGGAGRGTARPPARSGCIRPSFAPRFGRAQPNPSKSDQIQPLGFLQEGTEGTEGKAGAGFSVASVSSCKTRLGVGVLPGVDPSGQIAPNPSKSNLIQSPEFLQEQTERTERKAWAGFLVTFVTCCKIRCLVGAWRGRRSNQGISRQIKVFQGKPRLGAPGPSKSDLIQPPGYLQEGTERTERKEQGGFSVAFVSCCKTGVTALAGANASGCIRPNPSKSNSIQPEERNHERHETHERTGRAGGGGRASGGVPGESGPIAPNPGGSHSIQPPGFWEERAERTEWRAGGGCFVASGSGCKIRVPVRAWPTDDPPPGGSGQIAPNPSKSDQIQPRVIRLSKILFPMGAQKKPAKLAGCGVPTGIGSAVSGLRPPRCAWPVPLCSTNPSGVLLPVGAQKKPAELAGCGVPTGIRTPVSTHVVPPE